MSPKCPVCGDRAAYRVSRRLEFKMQLGRYYRCRASDGVYLHKIPTEQAATVPYRYAST